MRAKKIQILLLLTLVPLLCASVTCRVNAIQRPGGVNLEFYNRADDAYASGIKFPVAASTGTILYRISPQYIKLSYPADMSGKEIRFFSDNDHWKGSLSADRSGLVSTATTNRIPLYWITFSSKQSESMLQFNSITESSWNVLIDSRNLNFNENIQRAIISTYPTQATYLYLATKVSTSAAVEEYKAKLKLDVLDYFPSTSDTKAPVISPVAPITAKFRVKEYLEIKSDIEEDTNLKFARIYYRYKDESSYKVSSMTVIPDKGRPKYYSAIFEYPKDSMRVGFLQYYFEAGDGANISLKNNNGNPFENIEIIPEDGTTSHPVSGDNQTIVVSPGVSKGNYTQIYIPAGSMPKDTTITAKKLSAPVLNPYGNQSASVGFEFGPSGTKFNSPVILEIGYSDVNNRGLVDGSDFDERKMRIFWYDGFEWRNLGGTVNVDSNTVSVPISHFSVYALFAAQDPTPEEIRTREKIITPNGDGVNDLAQFGISGSFEIKIYDAFGHQIKKLVNVSVWDGKNEDGEIVESGVYLYQVKTPTQRVSGVVGVAR